LSTTWSPGLTPSLTSISDSEVAHVGNLAAMHHAVLDHWHVETVAIEDDRACRHNQ
jgi:hypothetical protein